MSEAVPGASGRSTMRRLFSRDGLKERGSKKSDGEAKTTSPPTTSTTTSSFVPSSAQEQEWTATAAGLQLPHHLHLPWEQRLRTLHELSAARLWQPEEASRALSKLRRCHSYCHAHAVLRSRTPDWLDAFVRADGPHALAKLLGRCLKLLDPFAAPNQLQQQQQQQQQLQQQQQISPGKDLLPDPLWLVCDTVRAFTHLLAVDSGISAIASSSKAIPKLLETLDVVPERTAIDVVNILSALLFKADKSYVAVMSAVLEKSSRIVVQPSAMSSLSSSSSSGAGGGGGSNASSTPTMTRRNRAATEGTLKRGSDGMGTIRGLTALGASFGTTTGVDRIIALMSRENACNDLLVASVIAFSAMLTPHGFEGVSDLSHAPLRARLLDACPAFGPLLTRLSGSPTCDPELRALIRALREKSPELREARDPRIVFSALYENIMATNPNMETILFSIMTLLSKLDRSEAVWSCIDEFLKSCTSVPVVGGDARSWFSAVLALHPDSGSKKRDESMAAVKSQLEAATRLIENCSRCSAASAAAATNAAATNPVVVMRNLKATAQNPDYSSEESSEFVDIDFDGQKAPVEPVPKAVTIVSSDGEQKRAVFQPQMRSNRRSLKLSGIESISPDANPDKLRQLRGNLSPTYAAEAERLEKHRSLKSSSEVDEFREKRKSVHSSGDGRKSVKDVLSDMNELGEVRLRFLHSMERSQSQESLESPKVHQETLMVPSKSHSLTTPPPSPAGSLVASAEKPIVSALSLLQKRRSTSPPTTAVTTAATAVAPSAAVNESEDEEESASADNAAAGEDDEGSAAAANDDNDDGISDPERAALEHLKMFK